MPIARKPVAKSVAILWRVSKMEIPGLSIEQQFNLKVYEEQVKLLSTEQAQTFLLEVMRQLMVKENVIKQLLKQS
jgi:hypothetical protein